MRSRCCRRLGLRTATITLPGRTWTASLVTSECVSRRNFSVSGPCAAFSLRWYRSLTSKTMKKAMVKMNAAAITMKKPASSPSLKRELARKPWRHVAQLGAQVRAHLHRKLPVGDLAVNRARGADVDEVLHEDFALHGARHVGAITLQRSIEGTALMDVHLFGGQLPFEVAADFHLPAIADLALDYGVFLNDRFACHWPCLSR